MQFIINDWHYCRQDYCYLKAAIVGNMIRYLEHRIGLKSKGTVTEIVIILSVTQSYGVVWKPFCSRGLFCALLILESQQWSFKTSLPEDGVRSLRTLVSLEYPKSMDCCP